MKKPAIFLLAFVLSCFCSVSYSKVVQEQKVAPKKIMVYKNPVVDAKVISKVTAWQVWHVLVPFHRKGDWVRVGFKNSGKVGWINLKQYRKLLEVLYKPKVKTVYVKSTTKPDKKGKCTIVAYEDGKKVTSKRAKQLFEKMQAQQRKTAEKMQLMNKRMDLMFKRMMKDFDDFTDLGPMPMPLTWPHMPVIQPVIVIEGDDS